MHLPPDATPGGTRCHHTHWDPFSAEPCTAVHLRPTMSPPVRGWIPLDSPGGLGGRCLGGLGCDSLAQLTFPGLAPRSLLVQLQRRWLESTDPDAAQRTRGGGLPTPSRALATRASGSRGRLQWPWHQRRGPRPLLRPPTRTARAHHFEPPWPMTARVCQVLLL